MRSFRHLFPNFSRLLLKTRAIGKIDCHPDLCASPSWRALYVAALFETDEGRMAQRIDDAKKALVVRAHELFLTAGDHLQEESAIEDTLQSLHALERCMVHLRSEALSGETDGRAFGYPVV